VSQLLLLLHQLEFEVLPVVVIERLLPQGGLVGELVSSDLFHSLQLLEVELNIDVVDVLVSQLFQDLSVQLLSLQTVFEMVA